MRLSVDEYRRGVVKWNTATEATVTIVSTDGTASRVSSPMSEPKGSIPDTMSGHNGNVVLRPMSPDSFDGVFSVTWDRLVGEEIVTITYDSQTGEQQCVGIPALGSFERLVVSTPYVEWNADMIVRTGDVMVRFTNHVLLERQSPIQIEHGQEQSSFTFDVSTHRLDGSFVEIIAPEGMGKEREIAFTVLALLALVVGDAVVGDVVQFDSLSSTPLGTEYAVRFPHLSTPSAANQTLRMPLALLPDDLDAFDLLLTRLLDEKELLQDVMLPLRWYERALRTESGVDKMLAAFLGLEALIIRRSERLGFVSPIAELLNDPRVPKLLEPLRDRYPSEHVERLLTRLLNKSPSLLDRFDRLADKLGFDEQSKATFRQASKGRHSLVHGGHGAMNIELPSITTHLFAKTLHAVLE